MIVVGLDLSLTGAGVAIIQSGGHSTGNDPLPPLCKVSTFGYGLPATAPLSVRGGRIERVADQVMECLLSPAEESFGVAPLGPDLVAIEDMPYGASGAGTIDRSALWWRVVNRLLRLDVPVVQVNVSTLKIYATGKGTKVGKDEVMLAVARRYPGAPITNNNEADAFGLAAIAARLIGQPIEPSLPQTHLRAMDKLVMPNG